MMKTKVNIHFLESKLTTARVGWGVYGDVNVRAQSTNTSRISENVVRFTEYNYLPVDNRTFDGHYTFYVNYKTFKYLITQHSYYGGLTYTLPAKENGWKKLNKWDKKYAEGIIAHKLLGMYRYQSNAVNSRGKNLFSTDEYTIDGVNYYGETVVRWSDGMKLSLLCDSYITTLEQDKEAINLIG